VASKVTIYPRIPISPLLLIGLGFIFGGMVCLNRIAVEGGIPPLGYAFWQCCGAGALMFVLAVSFGQRLRLRRSDLTFYATVGGLGLAVPWGILAIVAPHLPAGIVTLLLGLIPAATFGLALLLRMIAPNRLSVAGLLAGLGGLLLIVIPSGALPKTGMSLWAWVVILSVFASAMSNIVAERFRPRESSSLVLATGTFAAAALLLLGFAVATRQLYLPSDGLGARDVALGVSMAASSSTLFLFFEIVRRAGAVFVSQFNYMVVPSGIVWGMVVFHERHSAWVWIAIPLMLIGVTLVNAGRSRSGGLDGQPLSTATSDG
jgi:drug/metabolite transporter (DMT)-like permease